MIIYDEYSREERVKRRRRRRRIKAIKQALEIIGGIAVLYALIICAYGWTL